MEGFLGALKVAPGDLHAVIAGDGPYRESMRAAAKACGASSHVSFLGSIPHDQVIALHRHCEIYVSLNPMGNLSNSNLEAIKIGACMILPVSRPGRSVDEHADEIIAADAALRISSPDNSEVLTEALLRLHRDPNERKKLSMAAVISGRRSIPSWRVRINSELAMLEEIAATGKAPELSDSHDPATSAKF
jgi:glycosyltransferase involved in cell wall biosynthesis